MCLLWLSTKDRSLQSSWKDALQAFWMPHGFDWASLMMTWGHLGHYLGTTWGWLGDDLGTTLAKLGKTLAYSGTLWHTLAYSGILWHTLQKHPEWAASNITIFIIVTFEDIYIKLYIKYPMLVFVVYFKYLYQMMFVVLFRCDPNLRKIFQLNLLE